MSETPRRIDIHYRITHWARRIGRYQVGILIVAAALTAASILVTFKLRFNSDLADLLPRDNPELKILRRIQAKYAVDTAFMVLLSKNYVFVAERSGFIRMHDGLEWTRWPTGTPMRAIWGTSATEVFAAGDHGTVLRFDGRGWKTLETGTRVTLRGLWGRSPSSLFVVGDNGTVLHFDGKRWTLLDTGTNQHLHAVAGQGDEVFVVGDRGTLLRIQGQQVTAETGVKADLRGVWTAGQGVAAAVGKAGTFVTRAQGTWTSLPTPVTTDLHAVWGTSVDHLLAVGDGGVSLRFDGRRVVKESTGTRADLRGLHGARDRDIWTVGSGCTIRRWNEKWGEGPRISWKEYMQQRGGTLLDRLLPERSTVQPCTERFSAVWRPAADMARAKALAPRLAAALEQSPYVSRVEYKKPVQFFMDRGLLFSSIEDLEQLQDQLEESLERETATSTGLYVDLEEGGKKSREDLKKLMGRFKDQAAAFGVGTEEWFIHPDGTSLGLVVYPAKGGSDFEYLRRMLRDIQRIVSRSRAQAEDPLLRIDVSGDGVSKIREYDTSVADIFGLAPYAIGGIILLMVIYFRSPMGLLFVVLPLGMSICWTFAITTIFIGTLNLVTGFLFAVLFGLGIDYGLQLFGRYREGRQAGLGLEDAKSHMILDTGRATLTSAITTAAALLSLTLTDFRGFSEFGFIAGVGVLLAMLSFILVMPAIISLSERLRLLRFSRAVTRVQTVHRAPGPEPFVFPRVVLVVSAVLVLLAAYGATRVTFEYNLHNLRPIRHADEARQRSGSTLGRSFTPTLMLADSRDQLAAAISALKRKSSQLGDRSKLRNAVSILDFIPPRQHEKRAILDEIQELLEDKRWNLVSEKTKERVRYERLRRMARAQPFTLEDLPKAIRRAFRGPGFGNVWLAMVFHRADLRRIQEAGILREQFGRFEGSLFVNLGNLVPEGARVYASGDRAEIICPRQDRTCSARVKRRLEALMHDGRPLFSHVLEPREAYRQQLAVPGGLRGQILAVARSDAFLLRPGRGPRTIERSGTFHVSNAEMVLYEVVRVLLSEGRFAFFFAFSAIFIAALLDLRSFKWAFLATLPMAVGLLWTLGAMQLVDLKLNMFNFIILPALLGIGIDYGVHYVHRYQSEGVGNLGRVMRALYWVIFFCAATTIVSFGNMALASHPGLKSLGQLAIIGLACMFFASTYTLPALLYALERLKKVVSRMPVPAPADVVIYATSYSPACRLVRRFLNEHDIPFRCVEIDTLPLEKRREISDYLITTAGTDLLPLTYVEGRFLEGFDPDALLASIGTRKERAP